MNFFKRLFVGLGWAAGFFCYTMTALIVSSSKGRHRRRNSHRHHSSGFWKMLDRMIVYNWFCEGVRKSRTRVETSYSRRTGQSLWQDQKQKTALNVEHDTPDRPAHRTESTGTAAPARKAAPAASVQNRTTKTDATPKRKKAPESCHLHAVDQPAPVRAETKLATKENRVQLSGMDTEAIAANIPEPEKPKQKTAQEVEAERQMQMKNLRLALLDEVRAIHAVSPEAGESGANGSPEQQLSLLLYQPDLPQKELQVTLGQLRAERIRQKATYQGAPFADAFPVSLILAEDDSERACIVDVGETGMSYVIPWSSIPAELREILKRYVSEAGGKLLGYCKEELCNSSTNRMIVELYLGKQEKTASRILF